MIDININSVSTIVMELASSIVMLPSYYLVVSYRLSYQLRHMNVCPRMEGPTPGAGSRRYYGRDTIKKTEPCVGSNMLCYHHNGPD
ncbi:hypothetical protein KCU66_g37, partial [Aureobasidium melanogenum]